MGIRDVETRERGTRGRKDAAMPGCDDVVKRGQDFFLAFLV